MNHPANFFPFPFSLKGVKGDFLFFPSVSFKPAQGLFITRRPSGQLVICSSGKLSRSFIRCRASNRRGAARLLASFVERGGADDPNVRTVVERLRPLSRNEVGVLFGLMRRQTKGEIVCGLGIGHTRYHQIKAMLSTSFSLPPARMRKSQLRACIRGADLVLFPLRPEKCTFSDT